MIYLEGAAGLAESPNNVHIAREQAGGAVCPSARHGVYSVPPPRARPPLCHAAATPTPAADSIHAIPPNVQNGSAFTPNRRDARSAGTRYGRGAIGGSAVPANSN